VTQLFRRALLLAALLPPLSALAQEEVVPADPAVAPPVPARLPDQPNPMVPATPQPAVPLQLPPGMESLPEGAWRLRFPPGAEAVPESATPALTQLGRSLASGTEGRVVILTQASGPEDASTARRISLARGLAVKQALAAGGLPPTRIDIRPMGRTAERLDIADIQPPAATKATR
jgi:glucose/arabinose dehydrogenase